MVIYRSVPVAIKMKMLFLKKKGKTPQRGFVIDKRLEDWEKE